MEREGRRKEKEGEGGGEGGILGEMEGRDGRVANRANREATNSPNRAESRFTRRGIKFLIANCDTLVCERLKPSLWVLVFKYF